MAKAEVRAILSLLALGAIYWWFQMRMLDGAAIADQPASALLGVYIVVLAAATFAEIAINGGFAVAARGIEKDERDLVIEAKAASNERFFIIAAVNVLIWQALMEGLYASHHLPRIDLTSLPTLIFALFTVLLAGEAVRLISILAGYRLSAARA